MVNLLVEQLSGKVTQHDGLVAEGGRQLPEHVGVGGGGLLLGEASCQRGDVYQIVGVVDDDGGIDDASLLAGQDEVELFALEQDVGQIGSVAQRIRVVGLAIVDAARLARLAVGGCDEGVVPGVDDDPHLAALAIERTVIGSHDIGETMVETGGHGNVVNESDKLAQGGCVVGDRLAQLFIGEYGFGSVLWVSGGIQSLKGRILKTAQADAEGVDRSRERGVAHLVAVLGEQIVHLGEEAGKLGLRLLQLSLHGLMENLAEQTVAQTDVNVGGYLVDLFEEVGRHTLHVQPCQPLACRLHIVGLYPESSGNVAHLLGRKDLCALISAAEGCALTSAAEDSSQVTVVAHGEPLPYTLREARGVDLRIPAEHDHHSHFEALTSEIFAQSCGSSASVEPCLCEGTFAVGSTCYRPAVAGPGSVLACHDAAAPVLELYHQCRLRCEEQRIELHALDVVVAHEHILPTRLRLQLAQDSAKCIKLPDLGRMLILRNLVYSHPHVSFFILLTKLQIIFDTTKFLPASTGENGQKR